MKFLRFFIISYVLVAFPAFANDRCSHVDIKWLNNHAGLPPKTKIVYKKEKEDFCETIVLIETNLIPFYCGKDFVISGQLIKERKFLTDETLEFLNPIVEKAQKVKKAEDEIKEKKRRAFLKQNMKSLREMVSFKIGPKKYKESLYFVTDPACFHCKEMIKELKELSFEYDILVECIIYPLLGEKSEDLAKKAICKNFDYKDYIGMEKEEDCDPVFCKKGDDLIKKVKDFFQRAKLDFVPLVVSAKGDWIVEGDDINLVIKNLGINE